MPTVQYLEPAAAPPREDAASPTDVARISFRQPVSTVGYIDAESAEEILARARRPISARATG